MTYKTGKTKETKMTKQHTIDVNVILTFDTVINDYGTQDIFDLKVVADENGAGTVENMLTAIKEYMEQQKLPHTKLWKISTSANWTEFETRTGVAGVVDLITQTNGKWSFAWAELLTDNEKHMRENWGFGTDVNWTDETDIKARIIEEMRARINSKRNGIMQNELH